MRRTVVAAILALSLANLCLPAGASPAMPATASRQTITLKGEGGLFGLDYPADVTVPVDDDPIGRAEAWMPQAPGTKKWITLDYGPYLIHPGSDLSRMDVEIVGADGYAVGFEPSVVGIDGTMMSNHAIHIHHAHWYWLDPAHEGYHRWFYGTGEERTQGSFWPRAQTDPRFKDGLRYGVELHAGDHLGFLSMLHNKTAEAQRVYLRVRIQYVYGTHDPIHDATKWDFHNLMPALVGSTFNVPHTGGIYNYPVSATEKTIGPHTNYHNPFGGTEVVPGVGQVVKVPYSGTVIAAAGHMHPGGEEVVVSNIGRADDPCPDDGDAFPGVTAVRSRNIPRNGHFGSEEFQMGVTKDGWRMYLRKGDRLVVNGIYDSRKFGFPDAMSYFGFYTDTSEAPKPSQACTVELLDDPGASAREVSGTVTNQQWMSHHPLPTCHNCEENQPPPEPGSETSLVHIAGFQYTPGNAGMEGQPAGPPVVAQGDALTFVNEDYALAGVRHSVTSCRAPCNGPYLADYPLWDGVFHSGALGYNWEETYVNAKSEPTWSLDTSQLEPGWYPYFCQLHPWMRGSFFVK
jgi:plastocyanin